MIETMTEYNNKVSCSHCVALYPTTEASCMKHNYQKVTYMNTCKDFSDKIDWEFKQGLKAC